MGATFASADVVSTTITPQTEQVSQSQVSKEDSQVTDTKQSENIITTNVKNNDNKNSNQSETKINQPAVNISNEDKAQDNVPVIPSQQVTISAPTKVATAVQTNPNNNYEKLVEKNAPIVQATT